MHTTLWATLSATGSYAQASTDQPPRPAALADFGALVASTKNFIVGRTTFEAFLAQPSRGGPSPFADVDIVVVSSRTFPGVTCVTSPRAALEHLSTRGHQRTVLAGGAQLHNGFLADNLVDELALVVAPYLDAGELQLRLPAGTRNLALAASRDLGDGLVRLTYQLDRR